jgi:predicted DNA-binding transcriptional regulator AlpA
MTPQACQVERLPQKERSSLLKPEDVAEITGLSVETLAQWRSQKRGPKFVKISRNCVRYRQSDLDAWVSERIVRTDQGRSEGR